MKQILMTTIVLFFTWHGSAFAEPQGDSQWNSNWEGRRDAREFSGAFSPDGNLFAFYPGRGLGISDGKAVVHLWEVATQKPLKDKLIPLRPGEIPEQIIYTPAGDLLLLICRAKVSLVNDNGFRQEDVFACLLNIDTQRTPYIKVGLSPLAVCPKGERLAYYDGVWDIATGERLTHVLLPKNGLWAVNTCFSPDGSLLAYELTVGVRDWSLIYVVDSTSGKKTLQIGEIDFDQDILSNEFDPMFSPDGKAIITRTDMVNGSVIAVRDKATGEMMHTIPRDTFETALGLSSDNSSVVTWHEMSDEVALRDLATGEVKRTLRTGKDVDDIVYSTEHETLAIIQGERVGFLKIAD